MTQVSYLDASALVKLVITEMGSPAMLRWCVESERVLTSRIGLIETRRAAERHGHDPGRLRDVLATVEVMELDQRVADRAASVGPRVLCTLDAIHLATALEIGPEIDAFVTYDDRLAEAARAVGLPVVRPA